MAVFGSAHKQVGVGMFATWPKCVFCVDLRRGMFCCAFDLLSICEIALLFKSAAMRRSIRCILSLHISIPNKKVNILVSIFLRSLSPLPRHAAKLWSFLVSMLRQSPQNGN